MGELGTSTTVGVQPRRSGWRRLLTISAAVALFSALGSAPAHSENTDGACRIVGGNAALLADVQLPGGGFGLRGVIVLYTRACGDGAKTIAGAFQPVAGSTISCTPTPTPRIDESACSFTGSLGVALAGTPVLVTATAVTSGTTNEHLHDRDTVNEFKDARIQPGGQSQTSQCLVTVPEDGGRFGCTLF